jgi:hypothetical protein
MAQTDFMSLRHPDTVLALEYVVHERHICAGCQDSLIQVRCVWWEREWEREWVATDRPSPLAPVPQVWSATTFTRVRVLEGHTRAVLSLHTPKVAAGDCRQPPPPPPRVLWFSTARLNSPPLRTAFPRPPGCVRD